MHAKSSWQNQTRTTASTESAQRDVEENSPYSKHDPSIKDSQVSNNSQASKNYQVISLGKEHELVLSPLNSSGVAEIGDADFCDVGICNTNSLPEKKNDSAMQKISFQKKGGEILLTIHISPQGIQVELSGANVRLEAKNQMEIAAEHLVLRGEKSLQLHCQQDLHIQAEGDAEYRAQEHRIRAQRGSVRMKSTDDIQMEGERILLNA